MLTLASLASRSISIDMLFDVVPFEVLLIYPGDPTFALLLEH